jgi:hypothetical protein
VTGTPFAATLDAHLLTEKEMTEPLKIEIVSDVV